MRPVLRIYSVCCSVFAACRFLLASASARFSSALCLAAASLFISLSWARPLILSTSTWKPEDSYWINCSILQEFINHNFNCHYLYMNLNSKFTIWDSQENYDYHSYFPYLLKIHLEATTMPILLLINKNFFYMICSYNK